MKMIKRTFTHLFCLLIVLLSPTSFALTMEPLSLYLKPSGGGANQVFRVANDSPEPIAVQFSVTTRQQQGQKEIRNPADEQFNIYPPQTIIPPNTTQKVRVQWLGNNQLTEEKAFRIIAEQVHVSLEKQQAPGVKMLMKLVGALYVQPKQSQSNVNITGVKQVGNRLALTVQNTGTRHQLFKYSTLTLKNGGQSLTLKGNQLKGFDGNNILAKTTKDFYIPLPTGFSAGNWTASVTTHK